MRSSEPGSPSLRALAAALLLCVAGPATLVGQAAAPGATRPAPIVVRQTVPAPRAAVWEAWTTSAGLMGFLAPRARVELRVGGPFEVWFDPTAAAGSRGSEGCEVLAWIDQELLSFSWSAPPSFGRERARRSFVVLRFSDADDGRATQVELVHGGFAAGEGQAKVHAYFTKAWPFVLGNLEKRFRDGPLFEGGAIADAPPAQSFVIFVTPTRVETVMHPTDEESAILAQHADHIATLADRARVVIAGPCIGESFAPRGEHAVAFALPSPIGIIVVRANDMEEARAVMDEDPAVRAGIFSARVMPLSVFVER
jgi:uncharacterized protein YndB with AHSA1/START domain/uncharacterized protein YciI